VIPSLHCIDINYFFILFHKILYNEKLRGLYRPPRFVRMVEVREAG
jgi:hypothetical protein